MIEGSLVQRNPDLSTPLHQDDPTGSALDPGRLPGCDHVTQQERKLCVMRKAAQLCGNCG